MSRAFVVLLCLSSVLLTPSALARNEYLTWWAEEYPMSTSNDTACQLCHERTGGGNGWNRYGWSVRSAYFTNLANLGNQEQALKVSLQDIANLSDGGVSSYLQEINDNAQPGWLVGSENRIRAVLMSGGFTETFVSSSGVQPCGVFIDPPQSDDADEVQRVKSCSTSNPIESGIPLDGPEVALETIANGFTAPVAAVAAPEQDNVLYVVEQGGMVWHVNLRTGQKRAFLDFSAELVANYGANFGGYDERGLLGFAFHPNYANNNKVYTYISADFDQSAVNFTTLSGGEAADHMSEVAEWVVVNPLDSNSLASAKRSILAIAQPQFNHNGGMLDFGPEGYLYIAVGDGGNRNDEGVGHGSDGNARDNTNPLGSLLRIDVDTPMPANGRYSIPNSNPFVGQAGLDEIFVFGLRNPYRFSIETSTGGGHNLYIGDVGQDAIEELNRIPLSSAGSNFGWNYKEGSFFFSVVDGSTFVSPTPPSGVVIPPLVDPLVEYDHNEGISIIAGYEYQGADIPSLRGHYVFGDWGRSFASPDGRLFLVNENNQLREMRTESVAGVHVTGFGRDSAGEIYVVGTQGFRVTDTGLGSLQKIVPVQETCMPIKAKNGGFAIVCL